MWACNLSAVLVEEKMKWFMKTIDSISETTFQVFWNGVILLREKHWRELPKSQERLACGSSGQELCPGNLPDTSLYSFLTSAPGFLLKEVVLFSVLPGT